MSECPITNSIRKFRFNAGEMTQDELAKKVGVTRQTIIAIESAKYSPSLELAFRIARVFNTTVEEVFTYQPIENERKSS
jgi:putative transcriptional regulator